MRRLPLTLIFVGAALASGCGARTSEDDLVEGGSRNPGVGDGDGDGDNPASGGVIISSGGSPGGTGGAPTFSGGAPTFSGGAPTFSGGAPTFSGGAPALNDCCLTSSSPGCNAAPTQACVCNFDPYCCDQAWDQACVDEADRLCGAGCTPPSGGAPSTGGAPNTGGIVNSGGAPGTGGIVFTGGMPPTGGTGGVFGGDCCEIHGGTGCQVPAVQECVCDMDPYCCDIAWDGICTNEAQFECGATCGQPATGGAPNTGGNGGVVDQCINTFPDECGVCLCQNCFDQLEGCFADFGCLAILTCIDQSNCNGIDCYQPSTCQPTIDFFGGLTGPSAASAFTLGACSDNAACACD